MSTKRVVKGFLFWIINNVLAIATMDSVFIFLKSQSPGSLFRFVLFGVPWIITGGMIVSTVVAYNKACPNCGEVIDDYEEDDDEE